MIKVDALSYICLPLSYTPHQLLCLARCFVHTEITTNVFKWNKNDFYATWEELKFIRGKEHKFRMRLSAPQSKITQKFWHLRKKTKKHGLLPERHLTVARTLTTVHVHLCSPKDPSKGIWVTSEAFMTACQTLRRKQEEADSLFLWPTADKIASSSCWHTLFKKTIYLVLTTSPWEHDPCEGPPPPVPGRGEAAQEAAAGAEPQLLFHRHEVPRMFQNRHHL